MQKESATEIIKGYHKEYSSPQDLGLIKEDAVPALVVFVPPDLLAAPAQWVRPGQGNT